MSNVIQMKEFRFNNYRVGRKHLLRSLVKTSIENEAERAPFVSRQVGNFFRLARLRAGFTIEDAAILFDISEQELIAFEDGRGDSPAAPISAFYTRYGVEKDFEEFYAYLRGATRPGERAAFLNIRSDLEKMGWIRPQDW